MKRTMTGLMLLALMAVPVAFATACGGGAAADGDSVGKDVVSYIKDKKFDKIVNLAPEWVKNGAEQRRQNDLWRLELEQLKWKENFAEGEIKANDPEGKSGIDSKDKYKDADVGVVYAFWAGLYRIFKAKKLDDRLGGEFWLINYDGRHGLEGDATATLTYANKFNDTITVGIERIGGKWFLDSVRVNFPEEAEKNPTVGGRGGRPD